MLKHPIKHVLLICALFVLAMPSVLNAHCDSMSGPVIADAKRSLEIKDLTPVLKWIKKEYEAEITQTFQDVLQVRALSPAAQKLADQNFFETVVRLHRAGEGAPYTGLQNEPLDPVLAEADKALEKGSIDSLLPMLKSQVEKDLEHRFAEAVAKRKVAERSVQDGREYVEAYVTFVHYVEKLRGSPAPAVEHSH